MARFRLLIGLIALIGAMFSGLIASHVYYGELALEDAEFKQAVDIHARLVQERLDERELLTRVIVGLIRKPALLQGNNVLEPLRSAIYAFHADFVVAGWIARIAPADLAASQEALVAAGFPHPKIRDAEGAALNIASISQPLDVVMDVEPRNPETLTYPGRSFDRHPILGPLIARAATEGRAVCSDPFMLLLANGSIGIVLVAPVVQDGNSSPTGFITFSYRLAPLMLAIEPTSPFKVVLRDPRDPGKELQADNHEIVTFAPAKLDTSIKSLWRKVSFGGRDWTLGYYPKTDSVVHAQKLAALVIIAGVVLTIIICSLFGYVIYNNIRLSQEIQIRISFENRLTAVIGELNHRGKNILAVLQSIVSRTLYHGADIDDARKLLIGRIHALSNAVSLLSENLWQGVKLKSLLESHAILHAERIDINGPDITVSPRAAQSLSLLFFELTSHFGEGAPFIGKHPTVSVQWKIIGEGKDATFNFHWEEFNTSKVSRRPDSEFGIVLLDRVTPEALGGTSKHYFTDVSYVYELTACMATVVDQTEINRTNRFSAPLHSEKNNNAQQPGDCQQYL